MTQQTIARETAPEGPGDAAGLHITVRTGSGSGRTLLSAFDRALQGAGVGDFNLITLSSVIPAQSRISRVEVGPGLDAPVVAGEHGDVLFCVRSEAYAEHPGDSAWAGLGWCVDEDGAGLFVEHHGGSEQSVTEQIELSLADMKANRPGAYGEVETAIASAHCVDKAVCAVAVAAYRVSSWVDRASTPASTPAAAPATTPAAATELLSLPEARGARAVAGERPAPDAEPETDPLRITVEKEVDFSTAMRFWALYEETFAGLTTKSPARQVLHKSEFLEEMVDGRIEKYVAWDAEGRAVGLSTLTDDLESVPWISPAYFAHRYPDHYARGVVFYLGFTLVDHTRQRARVFATMLETMVRKVEALRGVTAWDICGYNDDRGLGRSITALLEEFTDITVEQIDVQNYYAGDFHGPRAAR